ncbi:MAG: grasp-with-spasm system SPASM domain peptide maturase [Chryseobacterium sp.]|jgi:SPASM domain peptide maturase of grasp-with-spasm system|uniref:grasp-with-spasm system SPASM domain peptide maturase n=1 Tax=Chryseobacterium sp. TaxID=1871047 RepID=UPI002836F689|nr:grasp-with-spasm system SPASM domain peptide maturase [Chryseobacterium sp.]MDR2235435.1 grasp-with-spasm system SPASM domain peptide maturase [Chryseobacterium sp.]
MTYFNLFSNILVTKGASRILISDLQRNTSELYPLELLHIINELKNKSLEDIRKDYTADSKQLFREYIEMLLEKEYGFITDGDWDRNFPPLSYIFHEPEKISNIFIEIYDSSVLDTIKPSLENLGVKHLVIYCHKKLSIKEFQKIDAQFKDSILNGIEIFSTFHDDVDKNFINKLSQNLNRVYSLVFHSCPKVPFRVRDSFRFSLRFSREHLTINSCGKINIKYFSTNFFKVSEALNHNSCLHKKIGIDIDGNIRNCPLMPESYGNIYRSTLEEALQQPGFRKYWNLTKDHIETCKDCEFRYICTDCRAYTERTHTDANGLDVSKPLKCGYDPYTGKWEAWSKNPLKQKAINFYKL